MKKLLQAKGRGKEEKWQHREETGKTQQRQNPRGKSVLLSHQRVQMADESQRVSILHIPEFSVWCFDMFCPGSGTISTNKTLMLAA